MKIATECNKSYFYVYTQKSAKNAQLSLLWKLQYWCCKTPNFWVYEQKSNNKKRWSSTTHYKNYTIDVPKSYFSIYIPKSVKKFFRSTPYVKWTIDAPKPYHKHCNIVTKNPILCIFKKNRGKWRVTPFMKIPLKIYQSHFFGFMG